jgi:hypothetical protein
VSNENKSKLCSNFSMPNYSNSRNCVTAELPQEIAPMAKTLRFFVLFAFFAV